MRRPFSFMTHTRNIYFVGLMGAGKTTVARQLAKRLKKSFIDTDHEIEQRTGVRVPVIFDIEGEVGFRNRETRLLEDISQRNDLVVATGGGIVQLEENRRILAGSGTVIYLCADPQLLYERTRRDSNRPLLQVPDPLGKLRELHALRDPLYRSVAHHVIETHHGSVGVLVKKIESELLTCEQ